MARKTGKRSYRKRSGKKSVRSYRKRSYRSRRSPKRSRYTKKGTLRKSHPSKGWGKEKPQLRSDRKKSYKNCGSRCFLEPSQLKFPICSKGSCKVSCKGLSAAYSRARQHRKIYPHTAAKAIRIAKSHGCEWSMKH